MWRIAPRPLSYFNEIPVTNYYGRPIKDRGAVVLFRL